MYPEESACFLTPNDYTFITQVIKPNALHVGLTEKCRQFISLQTVAKGNGFWTLLLSTVCGSIYFYSTRLPLGRNLALNT